MVSARVSILVAAAGLLGSAAPESAWLPGHPRDSIIHLGDAPPISPQIVPRDQPPPAPTTAPRARPDTPPPRAAPSLPPAPRHPAGPAGPRAHRHHRRAGRPAGIA